MNQPAKRKPNVIGRYQTEAMRAIWQEESQFARWTQVEVAASEVFCERGDIPADEMQTIRAKAHHQSAQRVREIEKETNHDVVAFVRAVGESVGEPAARHLHRGLTSSDVVDTALAIAIRDSLDVVIDALLRLQATVRKQAIAHKTTPCIGRTHGIHAEPTTFGLRLAGWFTELGRHLARLQTARQTIAVGKLSGAVGNFSQTDPAFEQRVLEQLNLTAEPIATQVVPRDRHAEVICTLALLGAGLERFATEVRALQRTDIRELEEPFTKGQTGSSAMPHKRNPITSERITGMARLLRGYAVSALEDVALWHDRDISHSSVERVIFPDAFHLAHYMLEKFTALVDTMRVYPDAMLNNLHTTKGLVFSQNVLGALLKKGHDRTLAYKAVQRCAMQVWEQESPSFQHALQHDAWVKTALTSDELAQAFDLRSYTHHIDALFRRAGIEE